MRAFMLTPLTPSRFAYDLFLLNFPTIKINKEQVDDCLFKVPREPLETGSITFRDMFLLSTGNLEAEQKSDENPIQLTGITKDELEQLLRVLFHITVPTSIDRQSGIYEISLPETVDQWTSVLNLADLWGFENVRQAAINHLKDGTSAAEKIALAQTYILDRDSWLFPACREILERDLWINVEEAQCMGLKTTLELAAIRQKRALWLALQCAKREPRHSDEIDKLTRAIADRC